jgi:hypothetical protein
MRDTRVTIPELALIAGTRVALGTGLGLLLGNRLSDGQRRSVGWTLFLLGAVTTIPLAMEVLGHRSPVEFAEQKSKLRPESIERGSLACI